MSALSMHRNSRLGRRWVRTVFGSTWQPTCLGTVELRSSMSVLLLLLPWWPGGLGKHLGALGDVHLLHVCPG